MKKYLFGVFALALAIGFSAYTTRVVDDRFFSYKGTGAEDAIGSYNDATTINCPSGTFELCGIVVDDLDHDGKLDANELTAFISSSRDSDHDGLFFEEGQTTYIKLKN